MVTMNIRLSDNDKKEADMLFKKLGITASVAVNMFIKECIREQVLPFTPSLNVPNQRLIGALKESESIIDGHIEVKRTDNFDEMIDDLD